MHLTKVQSSQPTFHRAGPVERFRNETFSNRWRTVPSAWVIETSFVATPLPLKLMSRIVQREPVNANRPDPAGKLAGLADASALTIV